MRKADLTIIDKSDLLIALQIATSIKKAYNDSLRKVIWFGSKARGEGGEDSDFDLIVIADFPQEERPPVRHSKIRSAIGLLGKPMDILPLTEEEFSKQFLFKETVLEEGIYLYDVHN